MGPVLDLIMPIKDRLKQFRTAAQLTQQELAVQAGLSISAVIHIEAGRVSDPRVSTLTALAKALGVTVDALLGENVPAPPPAGDKPKKPRGKGK